MAPNDAIGMFFGDQAQTETFLVTNMLAQRHALNARPWKTVETAEKGRWVTSAHDIWVICGPVYTGADDQPINPAERNGPKRVCIPVTCFKVVMAEDITLSYFMARWPLFIEPSKREWARHWARFGVGV